MSYSYPSAGRQVAGAADLARRRKDIERKKAVRRALESRRAGAAATVSYAAPVAASPAYAPAVGYPPAPVYRAPSPAAYPAPSASQSQPQARRWWEEEPRRKGPFPKHGKSVVAGIIDGSISLFIFAIAPALLMSRAAQSYGLDLSPQIQSSLLIGGAVAAFSFLRWLFMRGTHQRLLLSLAQVLAVVVWILVAISPNINLNYYNEVKIHIGLLRYLLLAAGTYALTALYYIGEYFVYKPMYEDIRRAKIAI